MTGIAGRELDRLVERRGGAEDPETKEALWVRSVERHNARLREENRAAWYSYHKGQAECLRRALEGLISHHEAQAAALEDG